MAASSRRSFLTRSLSIAAALAGSHVIWPARAEESSTRLRANVDYRVIPPQPVPSGDRIEVIEFFWYGCPYCYQLQPALDEWLARKPQDVAFRRVPAIFRESWAPHARIYYTLEVLGALTRLHAAVFESYHLEQLPLNSTASIADWAAQHGLNREQWLAIYESADIDSKVLRSRDLTRTYSVAGTPSLVVDGRYLTSSGMTPGVRAMIPVLDGLIDLARAEHVRR